MIVCGTRFKTKRRELKDSCLVWRDIASLLTAFYIMVVLSNSKFLHNVCDSNFSRESYLLHVQRIIFNFIECVLKVRIEKINTFFFCVGRVGEEILLELLCGSLLENCFIYIVGNTLTTSIRSLSKIYALYFGLFVDNIECWFVGNIIEYDSL